MRAVLEQVVSTFDAGQIGTHPKVGVLTDAEALTALKDCPLEVTGISAPSELATLAGDLDVVLFPAESTSQLARELLSAARARPVPPHLLPVGRFSSTETAVAAIEGRSASLLERPVDAARALEVVTAAVTRRRLEMEAQMLGTLLGEIGCKV
jgi:hypothetical protein